MALGGTHYSGFFLSVPGDLYMPPTWGLSFQLSKVPHGALCLGYRAEVDWFVPSLDELAQGAQEVLVGPSGGMSAGSSTALRPPPTLGMHGDHVVKILRTVAVLCSAPPSRALPRHCHAGYRQCRPLLVCPAPRPEHSAKPSPGGKAGGKTVNLADFSPF